MIFSRKASDDASIVNMLASALRRDIAFGKLLPDQKLKIESLRQSYGGSNHSMRETLRLLSAEGLVESTAQRGFRVTSATEDDLKDIVLVRCEIEKIALELAIENGDVAWEGRVIAAQHSLRKSEEHVRNSPDDLSAMQWDEAYRQFCEALIDACGSQRLIELQRKFFDQSRRFRLTLLREGRLNFEARQARHKRIVDAVLERNTELAQSAMIEEIQADLTATNR